MTARTYEERLSAATEILQYVDDGDDAEFEADSFAYNARRALAAAGLPALLDAAATLRAVMVDPSTCGYCEGTGWIFLDKSYDGYAVNGGQPYIEPDDTNGGYEPCGRCNSDEEVEFGSGDKVKPWRRWTDEQVAEIAAALGVPA